jgi:hypothetical protein
VKNKAPAPVQITAEQLLREAKERQLEIVAAVSKEFINLSSVLCTLDHINNNIIPFCSDEGRPNVS